MTERTLGAVRKRLRAGQRAAGWRTAATGRALPISSTYSLSYSPRSSKSTKPLLLCLGSRARGSRRSRRCPGGRGRRRRGRARRGLVILKIGRVLELVFRPRHFQLDVARVVRLACRGVVVVTAGIDRDSVECAHVNGDVLCANAEEPAYAYDHANNLAGPVK